MNNSHPPTSRRSPARRKALIAASCVIAAGAFILSLEINPSVAVPSPALPSPNAFDDYARAGALMKDKQDVDAVESHDGANPPPGDTQDRVLRDNAPALAALRQGFGRRYLSPPLRSFNAMEPYLGTDRSLARLLLFQANAQASRGDWGASAQTSLDGIRLGSDIPRGGGLMHLLSGVGVSAISRAALRRAVDHLSAAETRAALSRLRVIDADPQTAAQTLREEKRATQGCLMEMFRRPFSRLGFLGGGPDNSLSQRTSLFLTSKRRMMDDYTRYMDTAISDVEARRPISPLDPAHSDPLIETLAPIFVGFAAKCDDDRTQNTFLETELALHAYQLEHHAYPETLAALTPSFLPAAPNDPFAPGHPLCYNKTGDSYLLYSVGPDGVDDGGKAIDDPSAPSKRRRSVNYGSMGDVVAGVNL